MVSLAQRKDIPDSSSASNLRRGGSEMLSCVDAFLHTAATHRQAELDGVDGLVERPGELVLPQGLHHHVLHVLQLVGLPAGQKHTGHVTPAKLTVSHDNVAEGA